MGCVGVATAIGFALRIAQNHTRIPCAQPCRGMDQADLDGGLGVAILTTFGIVLSMLFETRNFFAQYRWKDFLLSHRMVAKLSRQLCTWDYAAALGHALHQLDRLGFCRADRAVRRDLSVGIRQPPDARQSPSLPLKSSRASRPLFTAFLR